MLIGMSYYILKMDRNLKFKKIYFKYEFDGAFVL